MAQEGGADAGPDRRGDAAGRDPATPSTDSSTPPTDSSTPPGDSSTLPALLLVTAAALVVRLVALGGRIFHWDEGRVGYWILRYHETGQFFYRPIIHGPFLPIVDGFLFGVLPATDFTARLPVAVVGGLLPLFAWLVRDRLNRTEVLSLALLLAFNPLLVYYSRFMRSDVLVGAFSLFALGFVVRAVDARRPGYLVAAGASFALGATAKENAIVYLVCFLGAGFLLLDHRVAGAVWNGRALPDVLVGGVHDTVDRLGRWVDEASAPRARLAALVLSPLGAVVAFLAVVVFFYAPRPAFWVMFGAPGTAPEVLGRATLGAWGRLYDMWATGGHTGHDYLPYLHNLLETLAYGAPALVTLVPLGLALDGYGRERFRDLVAFAAYVGGVSLLGYPIATDIQAPWMGVHVVLPLSIPAAVGLAFLLREARSTVDAGDLVGAALALLLLTSVVGSVAYLNVDYFNSAAEEDKQIIQWAQPHNDLRESLDEVRLIARHHEGTDVLFYGTKSAGDTTLLYVENESSVRQPPPGGPAWHSRLPLPWYLERYGATVNSTPPDADPASVAADAPPVVIAHSWDADEIGPHLEGYTAHRHGFKLWGETIVVYVDDSALERARAAEDDGT
ncbi:MAG: flippase activity-associated protein Agl23 [Haloferacaceae archaeon]